MLLSTCTYVTWGIQQTKTIEWEFTELTIGTQIHNNKVMSSVVIICWTSIFIVIYFMKDFGAKYFYTSLELAGSLTSHEEAWDTY